MSSLSQSPLRCVKAVNVALDRQTASLCPQLLEHGHSSPLALSQRDSCRCSRWECRLHVACEVRVFCVVHKIEQMWEGYVKKRLKKLRFSNLDVSHLSLDTCCVGISESPWCRKG